MLESLFFVASILKKFFTSSILSFKRYKNTENTAGVHAVTIVSTS